MQNFYVAPLRCLYALESIFLLSWEFVLTPEFIKLTHFSHVCFRDLEKKGLFISPMRLSQLVVSNRLNLKLVKSVSNVHEKFYLIYNLLRASWSHPFIFAN